MVKFDNTFVTKGHIFVQVGKQSRGALQSLKNNIAEIADISTSLPRRNKNLLFGILHWNTFLDQFLVPQISLKTLYPLFHVFRAGHKMCPRPGHVTLAVSDNPSLIRAPWSHF